MPLRHAIAQPQGAMAPRRALIPHRLSRGFLLYAQRASDKLMWIRQAL